MFLTMDRVGSSILATIQPLYKYRRESPLVPRGAGARVYVRAPLPAYYSTRFVISSSSSSPPCCFCTSLSLSLCFSFALPLFPFFFFPFLSSVSSSFLPSLTDRKLRSATSLDIGVKTNNETARER